MKSAARSLERIDASRSGEDRQRHHVAAAAVDQLVGDEAVHPGKLVGEVLVGGVRDVARVLRLAAVLADGGEHRFLLVCVDDLDIRHCRGTCCDGPPL